MKDTKNNNNNSNNENLLYAGGNFLVISVVVFRVSLFLVKMPFCVSFSLLCMTFLSLYLQLHSNQKTEGCRETAYLLHLYLDGSK